MEDQMVDLWVDYSVVYLVGSTVLPTVGNSAQYLAAEKVEKMVEMMAS